MVCLLDLDSLRQRQWVPELYPVLGYVGADWLIRNSSLSFLAGSWDELAFVGIGLLLLGRIAYYQLTPRFGSVFPAFILYLAVMAGLFLFNSPDDPAGIEGLRVMVQYVLWMFIGMNLIFSWRELEWRVDFFVLVCTLVALYGMYQYFTGLEIPVTWIDSKVEQSLKTRVYSIIGSPNILGSLMVFSIPAALALFKTCQARIKKYYYLGCMAVMLMCLVFTFSRGAWLGFMLAIFLCGLWLDRRILVAMLLLVVLSPVVMPSVYDRMAYMMSSDYQASSARGGRISRWTLALASWEKQPAVGVGLGRFGGAVAARYYPEESFYVDSWYLKVGTESGWIGLGATGLFILFVLGAARKGITLTKDPRLRVIGSGLLAGMVGVLLHNVVENVFEVPMMATYFWLFAGFVIALPFLPPPQGKVASND